ncbi:AraC family transcriptional regulator [Pseudoxanthobacter sp.]|uniref:AraC family transcriptional regulator n=1 Tax=Pseudoxanthobacter sp. TaxID=1925742 RepID=UPI002FE38649
MFATPEIRLPAAAGKRPPPLLPPSLLPPSLLQPSGSAGQAAGDDRQKPPQPGRRPPPALPKWRLRRVVAHIGRNMAGSVTLVSMAAAAGLSRMHFAAQFRIATGLRPHDFLLRCRIGHAQHMMLETGAPLAQIALDCGFRTQAHFSTVFRRLTGDPPARWRRVCRAGGTLSPRSRD